MWKVDLFLALGCGYNCEGVEVDFGPVSHFFFFLNPLIQDPGNTVAFTRHKKFSNKSKDCRSGGFILFCTSLLQAYFCCDANRNLKLANGLMGCMSSEVITLPDGQKL